MFLVAAVPALAACGGPEGAPSTPSAPTPTAPVTAEIARAVPRAEPTQAPSPTPTTAPPAAPATSSPAPTATAESTATAAAGPSPTSTPSAAPAATETPRPAASPTATPEPEPGEEDRSSSLKVITVLPFDAIPAILDPSFVTGDDAREQYSSDEMVLGLSIGDDSRAYSIPYLSSREIVNDVVGCVPVAVTW